MNTHNQSESDIAKQFLNGTTEFMAIINLNGEIEYQNPAFKNWINGEWKAYFDLDFVRKMLVLKRDAAGNRVYYKFDGDEQNRTTVWGYVRSNEDDRIYLIGADITEHTLREEILVTQANTDELTGALNRKGFFSALDNSFSVVDKPCAMFLFDLDGFKGVNDTLGHHAGDKILKKVVARCKKTLGDGDIIGRLGGDEFAVLAINSCKRTIAAEILKEVSLHYTIEDTIIDTISASIGEIVFVPTETPNNSQALLKIADNLMYESKRTGKGKVTTADLRNSKKS